MSSESSQARTAAGMELVSTPPQSVIRPRKLRATPGACGLVWPAASRGSSTSPSVRDLARRARHQARVRPVAAEAEAHASCGNDGDCRHALDAATAMLPPDTSDPALPYIFL